MKNQRGILFMPISPSTRGPMLVVVAIVMFPLTAGAQQVDSPQSRMRPIGSASLVDQYRSGRLDGNSTMTNDQVPRFDGSSNVDGSSDRVGQSVLVRETAYRDQGSVRQTAMQMAMPEGAFLNPAPDSNTGLSQPPSLPNASLPGSSLPGSPLPQGPSMQGSVLSTPRSLPQAGGYSQPQSFPVPMDSDLQPLSQPMLSNQYATLDNCACVSGPSTYSAASPSGCVPVNYQTSVPCTPYLAPPAQIAAPAIMPGGVAPPSYPSLGPAVPATASAAPVGSLLTFGQEQNMVQVGQGLIGQPKAYVPGQYFRNWLRYFTP
ncbi:hypothetical protein Pla22_06320 [Rubripirellula amarantea]|uniref:Uncharacterized protein n=1 Tax=Rubripirellula amarantea TaxID=2527999 RepID=A0A5C5WQ44_9BACT|nr:hypothetical protein [Rubripirellula amarantea]TWT53004.1 hypothetical protein Pla22_06320 [Rubripirellula amarantea]